MKKHYTDERTGISYTLCGDYYLPDFSLKIENLPPLGKYGSLHCDYLRKHQPSVYRELFIKGTLYDYLIQIDKDACEMVEQLTRQYAEIEDVSENLKSNNPMEWTRQMNSIYNRAEEFVLHDLIYN